MRGADFKQNISNIPAGHPQPPRTAPLTPRRLRRSRTRFFPRFSPRIRCHRSTAAGRCAGAPHPERQHGCADEDVSSACLVQRVFM
jgi:hypothetical protein